MVNKRNFWVDALIFIAFLLAFEPALTGIAIHEWLSLAFWGTIVLHLFLHWQWVLQVTLRFFRKLFHSSRLNYLVDVALFIAFVMVMLSGILISRSVLPALGITLPHDRTWRFLHSWSADLMLFLVGLHFALHWKWIWNTFKRVVAQPIQAWLPLGRLQPERVPTNYIER
ncbi:MAG: DUF4405 domain-containing protein [Chloroflexota bacterium]